MQAQRNPRAIDQLEVRGAGDEVLVHDVLNGKIHVLNSTAGRVLLLCDGSRPIEMIVSELAQGTGVARETIESDVAELLVQFSRIGLLSAL